MSKIIRDTKILGAAQPTLDFGKRDKVETTNGPLMWFFPLTFYMGCIGIFAFSSPTTIEQSTARALCVAVTIIGFIGWLPALKREIKRGQALDKVLAAAREEKKQAEEKSKAKVVQSKAQVLDGYFLGPPLNAQANFHLIGGDYPSQHPYAYLFSDHFAMPVPGKEALGPGTVAPSWLPVFYFKRYSFDDVTNIDVTTGGVQRSLSSVLGVGAVAALVNPLLALGAGAAVHNRSDQQIVAISFADGRRVLAKLNDFGLAQLKFAFGRREAGLMPK